MALSSVNGSVIAHPPITVASAATCNIGNVLSDRVLISGTTGITSFGTTPNALRFVTFTGILTITHHATSLILIGGANLTTAAGDNAVFASDGSGNWRCLQYTTGMPPATSIAGITGLQAALDAKLAASSYTAADVLAKLVTVDGSGSGIDADTLDGNNASAFVKTVNGASPDGSGAVTISISSGTQDVRLGAQASSGAIADVQTNAATGSAITGLTLGSTSSVIYYRPVQKYVSGTWITVSQV